MKVSSSKIPPEDSGPRYSAPALEKGLDILERLAEERLPLSQVELSQALGRTANEIYRMLACLEERGYVVREEASGKFRLSLRLYELAHKHNPTTQLRRAARMPMEALAEETGQACHLSVLHGRSLLVMMERMPLRQICLAVGEGAVVSLLKSSSGRMLLSRMDDVDDFLASVPEFTALSSSAKKQFTQELVAIRDQSSLVAGSDVTAAVSDIVAPVGVRGTDTFAILASCCLIGPESDGKTLKRYQKAVVECAAQINRNLGITP